MKETDNLQLKKPDLEDFYNIEDFNINADVIDAAIYALQLAKVSVEERKRWDEKADNVIATQTSAGLESADDKKKLDGIAEGANAYTHPSYTARTGVPTDNQTPAFGGSFTVTQPVSDANGHITGMNSRTVTIPNTVASQSAAGLESADDKKKLDGIAEGANAYTHPSYTARTGVPTSNQTPSFGGSFTVTQPVSDGTGHITGMNSRTVTIPNTVATQSAAGLESADDKKKLDGIAAGAQVNSITGVKGNAESSYRTGNVNLTPANLGALATNGDSKSNTVTFTSNDVADGSATSWTNVTKLASGITHATFFQRVSQMFKNVRYLYKVLGTTDISAIGDGTVKGAISTLNSNLAKKVMVSPGTVSNGYVTIKHNLNISDMVPICQVGNNAAVLIYNTQIVNNNSFRVGVMYANGYSLSAIPDGTDINIIWTY